MNQPKKSLLCRSGARVRICPSTLYSWNDNRFSGSVFYSFGAKYVPTARLNIFFRPFFGGFMVSPPMLPLPSRIINRSISFALFAQWSMIIGLKDVIICRTTLQCPNSSNVVQVSLLLLQRTLGHISSHNLNNLPDLTLLMRKIMRTNQERCSTIMWTFRVDSSSFSVFLWGPRLSASISVLLSDWDV